jgi:hypothetical protein
MTVFYVYPQVRERPHQLRIIRANSVATVAMVGPRFVVVPRVIAKRGHHRFQIVPILALNVVFNQLQTRVQTLGIHDAKIGVYASSIKPRIRASSSSSQASSFSASGFRNRTPEPPAAPG